MLRNGLTRKAPPIASKTMEQEVSAFSSPVDTPAGSRSSREIPLSYLRPTVPPRREELLQCLVAHNGTNHEEEEEEEEEEERKKRCRRLV